MSINLDKEIQIVKEYYDTGETRLKSIKRTLNGKLEGLQEKWNENGNKKYEVSYKAGEKEGITKYWHDNGSIHIKSNYRNDKLEGEHEVWYNNGNKLTEQHFKNGFKNGIQVYYFDDGNISKERYYVNGELKSIPDTKQESDCINQDMLTDEQLLVYTDMDVKFCFTKNDLKEMVNLPINPYTGLLLDKDFVVLHADLLFGSGKFNETLYNGIKETLNNNSIDEYSQFNLSLATLTFLHVYVTRTYMVKHNYFRISPKVRLELTYTRLSDYSDVKLYRGIHFGFINLDYFNNFIKSLENGRKINESTYIVDYKNIKPTSTTRSLAIARAFANKDIVSLVGNYQILDKNNVLTDPYLIIDYLKTKTGDNLVELVEREQEVILLPGYYNFIVTLDTTFSLSNLKTIYEFLLKFKEAFKDKLIIDEHNNVNINGNILRYNRDLRILDSLSFTANVTVEQLTSFYLKFNKDIRNLSVIIIFPLSKIIFIDQGDNYNVKKCDTIEEMVKFLKDSIFK